MVRCGASVARCRRACVRWRRRALVWCALAAGAAAALVPAWGASDAVQAELPGVAPHAAAQRLADFSALAAAGAWRVLEDAGAGGAWRYRVAFECGARCAGEAAVRVQESAGGEHSVRVLRQTCRRAPLLPWLRLCEYAEVQWAVAQAGAGSAVRARARAWCGAARALLGGCARELRALTELQLRAARP